MLHTNQVTRIDTLPKLAPLTTAPLTSSPPAHVEFAGGDDLAYVPYAVPGAPLVPPSQDVEITFLTPHSFDYVARIHQLQRGRWEPVMHHGGAYAVDLPNFDLAAFVGNAVLPCLLHTLPVIPDPHSAQFWAYVYDLLANCPNDGRPRVRYVGGAQRLAALEQL